MTRFAASRRAPGDRLGFAAFGALAVLALLWLVTGLWMARGRDRDPASALWSAVVVIGAFGLIHWQWYLPPTSEQVFDRIGNATLRGLYIAAIAAGLVRFWLAWPIGKVAVTRSSGIPPTGGRQSSPWARTRLIGGSFGRGQGADRSRVWQASRIRSGEGS